MIRGPLNQGAGGYLTIERVRRTMHPPNSKFPSIPVACYTQQMKTRWTHGELLGKAYPMSRCTNVRFALTRKLPMPCGATWARWFREQAEAKRNRK